MSKFTINSVQKALVLLKEKQISRIELGYTKNIGIKEIPTFYLCHTIQQSNTSNYSICKKTEYGYFSVYTGNIDSKEFKLHLHDVIKYISKYPNGELTIKGEQ